MKKKLQIMLGIIFFVAGLRYGHITTDAKYLVKKVQYCVDYYKFKQIEKKLPYGFRWISEFYRP